MNFSTHLIKFNLSKTEVIINVHVQSIDGKNFIIGLTNKGNVLRLTWGGKNQKTLANICDCIDIKEKTEIYCYENYIALVNNRKTKGVVLNTSRPNWYLSLLRGDYCAHVSSYPISFFTRNNQVHIIHGTDWNRLDITNLDTEEFLTHRTTVNDPGENGFDYFHGKLYRSPNEENFVSTGWHWHPVDWMFSLNIDSFLKTYELGEISINRPDDMVTSECVFDRPLYLIDNETIAWGYNPTNFDAKITQKQRSQLIIQNIQTGKVLEKLPFDYFSLEPTGNQIYGELYYDLEKQYFITFSGTHDFMITNRKGVEMARQSFFPDRYIPLARVALKIQSKSVEILSWSDE